MEKFSVKKPFTVLVAVVMILILGFVAVTKMDTNLLPNVNTPYLMVVTVYPGASPERVESEVSDVPVSYTHLDVYKRQADGRCHDIKSSCHSLPPI